MVEVVVGDTQVEEGEGFVEVLRAHQEHDAGIFPHLLLDVDLTGPLENELVLDLISSQVADADTLLVELECLGEVAELVVTVTGLRVAAQRS
jgi:hypothetical protein